MSSHSADTTGDLQSSLNEHREFLLSPIRTTELTASGHFKKFTAKEQKSETLQQPSHKAAIGLSPIHVKVPDTDGSKSRNQTSSLKSKVEHKDADALSLSPIHAPVRRKDSEEVAVHTTDVGQTVPHRYSKKVIQSHMPSADPSDHPLVSSLRVKNKVPTNESQNMSEEKGNVSSSTPQTGATETVLKVPAASDAQPNTLHDVSAVKKKGQQGSLTSLIASGVQFSESGLERDLAELQSALEAAGLPKLGGEDEQHEPVQHAADSQVNEGVMRASNTQSARQERGRMVGGSEVGGDVGGTSIEDMIRAITASELASLTKEILLQDLEKGDTATPEPGHIKPPESPSVMKQETGRSHTHVEPSTKALPLHATTADSEDGKTSMQASERLDTDHVLPLSEPHELQSSDQAGFDLSPIHVTGDNGLFKHLELSRTSSGMREKPTVTRKQGGRREGGAKFSGSKLTTSSVRKTPSASTAVAYSTQSKRITVPPAAPLSSTEVRVTPRSSIKPPGFSKLALSSGHLPQGSKPMLSTRRVPSSGRVCRTKPGRKEELKVSRTPVKKKTAQSDSSLREGGAVETNASEKEPASVMRILHESHLNSEVSRL